MENYFFSPSLALNFINIPLCFQVQNHEEVLNQLVIQSDSNSFYLFSILHQIYILLLFYYIHLHLFGLHLERAFYCIEVDNYQEE
jgi:hypothetical protein